MNLEVKSIHTFYNNIEALRGINLTLHQGEIVTLVGANGAGKSTTLMSISGLKAPRHGEILLDGESIHLLSPSQIVSKGIVQVPEGRRIFPNFTVRENLDMGAFRQIDRNNIKQSLEYVFDLFPILEERINQYGGTMSGGEQQMLAISRALMANPRILLLDEPSLGLAPRMIQKIFAVIERINKENDVAILLVEQNANQALQIAHRGYVLENGMIVTEDDSSRLLSDDRVRKSYLGLS